MQYNDASQQTDSNTINLHGAAVIDDNGNETPITNEMIEHACEDLATLWQQAHSSQTSMN